MKILYSLQGTGNGHISRARDIVPILMELAEVDLLISGVQADVTLPFEVKYRFKGMSFIFGKKGGVDLWATYQNGDLGNLMKEIKSLPVTDYDLVINDFEPVSAWACKMKGVKCVSLSHQSAVLSPNAPKPSKKDLLGSTILKYYIPAASYFGFHFEKYEKTIFTPVIRRQIRDLQPTNEGHYTVYLPAYKDELLIKHLSRFPNVNWQVFSKHNKEPLTFQNVSISPINNEDFVKSLASSNGVLCGAGFETPAEALFLKKKILVIPMKNQYEQALNAASLEKMGVPVIKNLKRKNYATIANWLEDETTIQVNYPDVTKEIIEALLHEHYYIHQKNTDVKYQERIRVVYKVLGLK